MNNMKDIKDHFLSFVSIPENLNDCWEWIGGLFSNGYGAYRIGKRTLRAHRISFSLFVGEIPDGLYICHKCDNKKCVNPSHLFLGTHQDNMDDMKSKHRVKSVVGENHGRHKLTEKKVYKILEMIEQGINQHEIAKMFGVNHATISSIKTGKNWKWLKRKG